MMHHAREITTTRQTDGDLDAVVIKIDNTGSDLAVDADRYRHTITHGLGRVPVGCQVIMKDKECDVYVVSSDANQIVVTFTAAKAAVNVRIW